jgi:hypothetical protein
MCTLVTLAQIIFRVQELAVQGSHVLLHGTALMLSVAGWLSP